jgi:tetrahydromethanopterin S-methyltransferase subunit A
MYIKFMERMSEESIERNQQTEELVAKVKMSDLMLEEMHLRQIE